MLKCPRCGTGLARERAQLRADVARENVLAMVNYYPFTAIEREIVLLAIDGLPYKEIAEKRHTTEQVIKNYMALIFDITGSSTRPELQAMFAFGEVPDGPSLTRDQIRFRVR